MKIALMIDTVELEDLIANSMRYKALENGGVDQWSGYYDALQAGLGDYLDIEGDYISPYNSIAYAIVKEACRMQMEEDLVCR